MNEVEQLLMTKVSEVHSGFLSDKTDLTGRVLAEIRTAYSHFKFSSLNDFPYKSTESALIEAEQTFDQTPNHKASLEAGLEHFSTFQEEARLPKTTYWDKELDKLESGSSEDAKLTHLHLLTEWRRQFDRVFDAWKLEQINRFKRELYDRLNEWLLELKKLEDALAPLGQEPGFYLDFSSDQLSLQEIETIRRWVRYITNDEGVKNLCELLGKIRQASASAQIEKVNTLVEFEKTQIDVSSKEEIVGICLGKDLENTLPSELALLSDSETSVLFDLKYIENRLMCFDLVGMQSSTETKSVQTERMTQLEDGKGPLVICVDTSGSMYGEPESVAKAITLALVSQAKRDERACYLINFSTGIETLDFSGTSSMKTLLEFLRKSFHGGTDVAPALHHGIQIMEQQRYEDADMLVVSDFVMSDLPDDLTSGISTLQNRGNSFYSLCIGDAFMTNRLKHVFDQEWIFDPRTSRVSELVNFQNSLSDSMRKTCQAVNELS